MILVQYAPAMRLIFFPIFLMQIASAGAQESGWEDSFEIERFSWIGTVPIEAGRCDCNIAVLNQFGSVRARFGGYGDRVEVFANIQHFVEEKPRLVVETRESSAGVQVIVGYPDAINGELLTIRNEQKKRADLVVWVPRNTPLFVSTDEGLIDIEGLRSDVQARSSSGNITARKIAGNLNFDTSSGSIMTLMENWDVVYHHVFTTGSGEQTISFGGEVDARIRMSTSGLISTDFSMEVDYVANRQPVRKATALIGNGAHTVSISSTTGRIRLSGSPLARKARVLPGTAN